MNGKVQLQTKIHLHITCNSSVHTFSRTANLKQKTNPNHRIFCSSFFSPSDFLSNLFYTIFLYTLTNRITSPNALSLVLLLSHDFVLSIHCPIAHFHPLNFCLVSCSLLTLSFTNANHALLSNINDYSFCLPRC